MNQKKIFDRNIAKSAREYGLTEKEVISLISVANIMVLRMTKDKEADKFNLKEEADKGRKVLDKLKELDAMKIIASYVRDVCGAAPPEAYVIVMSSMDILEGKVKMK